MSDHASHCPGVPQRSFWRSRTGLAFAVLLAIGLFYLITEHQAHVFGLLPFAFLLACPLMHVFMHGKHGHHGARCGGQAKPDHDVVVRRGEAVAVTMPNRSRKAPCATPG